jgi:exopolyphosphatase/guanosine-5'-triphosphate,3'-diphosphate pyrophosphatase
MSPTRSEAVPGPQTIGFIDIGTNSVRLMVVRLQPDRSWTTITLQKEPVRLGEGEFGAESELQPAAMDRAAVVCRSFAELARSHGAQTMVAVATSATREAGNQAAFVRRLREEAGIDVHVVSGQEEARLIFLGVLSRVHLGARRALVIDIGGGSTEVALGDHTGAEYLDSLRLGAIRLTSEFPQASAAGPVSAKVYEAMRRRVQVEAVRIRRRLAGERIDVVFGTSGTIRNLASAIVRTLRDETPQRVDTVTRDELRKVAKLLRSLGLEERRAVSGLNPLRADIVIAGAAILDALMEDLGLTEIQAVAECGLREGLVVDHLARGAHEARPNAPTVRERSVLQLARACAFDETHARHVAGLALDLFDSARSAGLHRYGDEQRELFWYAALLHDVGTFLSYTDHHLHSYYLIRHADLLGFDEKEIATVAATALFHRKSRPGGRHPAFAELDRPTRRAVRLLSVLLRLAEYMDRSHSGAVAHAALRADGPGALVLEISPAKDWHLERWRLENRRDAIEKGLGRSLTVKALEP